jgi:hypothetical protein
MPDFLLKCRSIKALERQLVGCCPAQINGELKQNESVFPS